jgi:hypothetical protein
MYYTFYKNRPYRITVFEEQFLLKYNETFTRIITDTEISERRRNLALDKENILINFWNTIPEQLKNLTIQNDSMQSLYFTFRIPKKTRGFREINAPNEFLKEWQTKITNLLQKDLQVATHNAAFAYVKNRSVKEALEKHQGNRSKWFLKLDIKDFFPSCTKELVYNKLINIYPFALFTERGKQTLKKLIHICCLNGVLPQGSPASPYLSNVIFTDFDYKISYKLLTDSTAGQCFIYTRYADDILISARKTFNWTEYQNAIQTILGEEFKLKTEKTRYGSSAGRNWNLGLMLNKDNNITVGHVNKQNLKSQLHHFIIEYKEGHYYSIPETQHLQGILNYAKQIEPDYINYLIQHYSRKFNCDILEAIKYCLKRH